MTTNTFQVEVLDVPQGEHYESPIWDEEEGTLLWVDIFRGEVHSLQIEANIHRIFKVGSDVGAIGLANHGEYILATRGGFALLIESTGEVIPVASPLRSRPDLRMNDGGCDRQGRFWAGSMAYDASPNRGALFCLSPEGTLKVVIRGVTISNGIAWDARSRYCYYVDSATRCVDVFDFDVEGGHLSNRRVLIDLSGFEFEPDGLTVDANGFIWVALWDGGEIRRYSPDGELDISVELPVSRVTSCTFGGDILQDLYITTSRFGLDSKAMESEQLAGSLFVIRGAGRGQKSYRFNSRPYISKLARS